MSGLNAIISISSVHEKHHVHANVNIMDSMMKHANDIVDRLRGPGIADYELDPGVARDAADEIERLRERLNPKPRKGKTPCQTKPR